MMRLLRKKNSGFSLIEILISMGLVSVLALVIFALNNFMNKGKSTSDAAFQADQFRKDVVQQLNNPAAWRQTLRLNATFSCLRNDGSSGDCSPGISQGPPSTTYTYASFSNGLGACASGICYGGFDVYNANGQPFYSPATSASAGFQSNGTQCSAFSGSIVNNKWVGTSKCPFRLVLYWQPICPTSGPCRTPAVHVKGYTLFAPSSGEAASQAAFNPGNYGIDLILAPSWN